MSRKVLLDITERAGWTFAQAFIALLITHKADWPTQYAAAIALGLSVLKGFIATKIGDRDSAATLPAGQ